MVTVEQILSEANERRASDLHLAVGVPPSVRVDGGIEFLSHPAMTADDIRSMVQSLVTDAQMQRLDEQRELEFSFSRPSVGRCRAAVFYVCGALSVAFRIIPAKVLSVYDLKLPNVVHELARKTSGLIIFAGATGQGKTTTMNAILDLVNSERRCRIITIEDPIEFVHNHRRSIILQREVDEDTHSFGKALRSALRQDPNIISVGEMRDLETISTALTAAETGHLVISTLHTQSAAQTVNRIIDVFPSAQQNQVRLQLANTLQGVICQKLLPLASGTGRILAYEVMLANNAIRHLIRDGRIEQIQNVLVTGREEGMMPFDYCLRMQYENGLISYDTAVSAALDPNSFKSRPARRPEE